MWYRTVNGSIRDMEFKPNDPNTIYIGRDRFFVSTDGGENFENLDEGLPSSTQIGRIAIAVTPDDENYVYLLIADDDQYGLLGVYRSTDSGQTFEETFTSPNILNGDFEGNGVGGQGWYDLAIAVNPNNKNNVFCGGVNLWESNDAGESFDMNAFWVWDTPGTEYVHADIHQLDFYNGVFYVASDGGLWTSTNFGNSFTNRSFGLEITQCYRIGVDPQNADRYILGSQDNGTMLHNENWYHVQGGDGMQCFFHPTDASKVYVSSQFGSLFRSDNGGNDFEWAAGGINDQGAWTTPWELDVNNPTVMYAGYQNVWKSLTGGASWTPVTNNINSTLRFIDISPINGQRVYAATYDDIYRTIDGGANWNEINIGPLPNADISWIAAGEFDETTLYVCLSGTIPGGKVYKTTDNGLTWENISGNLPNVPFNTIVEDPNLEGSLYVGSDIGIYHKHPDFANWEDFGQGLPVTIVRELEIHEASGQIYAGTYGRGVWVSNLFELPDTPPVAAFEADKQTTCAGGQIEFTDQSLNHYPQWTWTFEGGEPATSSEANPEVIYPTPGVYPVTLTVVNANGESTTTTSDYIYVYENEGLPIPYEEGFESTVIELPEWELESTDDSNFNWIITEDASYGGDKSLLLPNADIDEEHEYSISSTGFNLSEVDTATLTFFVSYVQRHEDNDDRLRLYVSQNCGATWSIRDQWSGETDLPTGPIQLDTWTPNDQSQWEMKAVTLAQGDLVDGFRFRFWWESDNGNQVYIANINLFEGVVNVEEEEARSFS
ncbi:MAG: PKD domain-containing protein, partial [Flavobacteriales bacterium]|nr:PKD domain-containing protein [Flavobacteriales bacterium]